MGENLVTNIGHCTTIVSDLVNGNVSLIYYSHIPTAIITLLMGVFVLRAGKSALQSKILFTFCTVFSIWILANLISWISTSSVWIMFSWSLLGMLDVLFYILSLYFFYVFVNNKDISFRLKLILSFILLPFLFLTPTSFNLDGFDHVNCMAIDKSLISYLPYPKILIALWMVVFAVYKWFKAETRDKLKIAILSLGLALFLFSVFITGYIADYYERYDIELYGLYAMTAFMGIIAFLIVKFKAFNIKLLGAQALVYSLIILIGSQFFFIRNPINMVLTGITTLLTIIFGYFLILGVKKEIAQREEIQKLADALAKANDKMLVANEKLKELDKQKTEFVSIASHQLRSPLTAIKGYSSMLIEGSFGELNDKAREAVDRIFESSQRLVGIIEDFLNITRIELGKMKYEMSVFDLGAQAKTIMEELQPMVEKRGLKISFEQDEGEHKINADTGKVSQVISNMIDNAIKYTKEGTISLKVESIKSKVDNKDAVRVSIKDTGVGIDPATMPKLFEKFIRAYDAGKTNIIGTGLGLYVAKQIVEALGGRIWAESEGKGKGSTFCVEFAVAK